MKRLGLRVLLVFVLMGGSTIAAGKPSVAEITKRAEKGNAKAQYTLGVMYENGDGLLQDSAIAVKWYRMAAEQGYPQAQASLGYMYSTGEGVPKDSAEAVKWYRKAAERGNATAQYNLGLKYATGDGVPKDSVEAVKWYREAADQGQGHAKARYNLGVMYENGDGVPRNGAEAEKWYRKAAEQDYAKAQANLGYMYATGDGIPKDSAEAVKWYRKAAEQGDTSAQYNLGLMFAMGEGVPKDLVQAHVWLNAARTQGDKDVRRNLAAIEKDMTVEQKTEAKAQAAPAVADESKGKLSGWFATFQPAKGTRLDFLPARGGFQEAEEISSCRYGIWVSASGSDAKIEISTVSGGKDAEAAELKPGAYRAAVLQRSEDMIVLKVVLKTSKERDRCQFFSVFPKLGAGFLSTYSASIPGPEKSGAPSAASDAISWASGSVIPLVRVD